MSRPQSRVSPEGQVVSSTEGMDLPNDGEYHHVVMRGKRRWLDGKRVKDWSGVPSDAQPDAQPRTEKPG